MKLASEICEAMEAKLSDYELLMARSWIALLQDYQKPASLINKFQRKLETDGLYAVIREYADLLNDLLKSFNATAQDTKDLWARFRKSALAYEFIMFMKGEVEPHLSRITTFCCWLKKAAPPHELSDDVMRASVEKFFRLEDALSQLVLGPDIAQLRVIVDWLVKARNYPKDGPAKHGPGSVNDIKRPTLRKKVNQCRRMKSYATLERRSNRPTFIDQLAFVEGPSLDPLAVYWEVPKEFDKVRAIAIEQCPQQLLGQWILGRMKTCLETSNIHHYVDLGNQSHNQTLALRGSVADGVATIDCSDASDLVAWRLVKLVFPEWLTDDLCLAREAINVNGEIVQVEKFAPMGSAVCFPTQCVLYTAIALLASFRSIFPRSWNSDVEEARSIGDWLITVDEAESGDIDLRESCYRPLVRVYGDDIIVSDDAYRGTVDLLVSLGFSVNKLKSYSGRKCPFRESCGHWYYDGYDITPVYFRPKEYSAKQISPKGYASLIGCINLVGQRRLHRTKAVLLHALSCVRLVGKLSHVPSRIPFVADPEDFGVYTPRPQMLLDEDAFVGYNPLTGDWPRPFTIVGRPEVRWNNDLQRLERLRLVIRNTRNSSSHDENSRIYLYHQAQWSPRRREVDMVPMNRVPIGNYVVAEVVYRPFC